MSASSSPSYEITVTKSVPPVLFDHKRLSVNNERLEIRGTLRNPVTYEGIPVTWEKEAPKEGVTGTFITHSLKEIYKQKILVELLKEMRPLNDIPVGCSKVTDPTSFTKHPLSTHPIMDNFPGNTIRWAIQCRQPVLQLNLNSYKFSTLETNPLEWRIDFNGIVKNLAKNTQFKISGSVTVLKQNCPEDQQTAITQIAQNAILGPISYLDSRFDPVQRKPAAGPEAELSLEEEKQLAPA